MFLLLCHSHGAKNLSLKIFHFVPIFTISLIHRRGNIWVDS
uniref:Uncharacterized protein n=1 Tax=Rhizophora mucronata TaxID=61149 RepID=A0A2P2QGG6_RHIMU